MPQLLPPRICCPYLPSGRVPNTQGLGLEAVGVSQGDKGQVLVDDHLRTNVPSIYAVGDVIDKIQLTPGVHMHVEGCVGELATRRLNVDEFLS